MAQVIVDGVLREAPLGTLLAELLPEGHAVELTCGKRGWCGSCRITASGALSPVTSEELRHLSPEELTKGIRLACLTRVEGDCTLSTRSNAPIHVQALGVLPAGALRPRHKHYGIAIDIGTTTLAACLYDAAGTLLGQASSANPQAPWGADVLSRVGQSINGQAAALGNAICRGLGDLILQLCSRNGLNPNQVDALVITGNTAMLYLLTQADPTCLSRVPFEADRLFGITLSAAELDLPCPAAEVYLPRCISAFVGADITTALLAAQLCNEASTRILVDVGTNGEMALWHKGALLCCSTAAGPAFEGAGLSMGRTARIGTVDHVTIWEGSLNPHIIGDAEPEGICGSGIVDALACLLELEQLDESGLLDDDPCPIAGAVSITQKDVRMIQLAKSAICAGIRTLLESAGVSCDTVAELALAGGFGSCLNGENAGKIGLLPEELVPVLRVLGNAALSGAVMLLLDRELAAQAEAMAKDAKTIDLSTNPIFMTNYTEGMFF